MRGVSLYLYLLLIIAFQYIIQIFFTSILGLNILWVILGSDLIFAFIFALLRFPGNKKDAFHSGAFYRDFIFTFIIFGSIGALEVISELILYGVLGLSYIWVTMIMDFVVAFLFAFMNYPGRKKDALKDPRFHTNVAIYFAAFATVTFIQFRMMR